MADDYPVHVVRVIDGDSVKVRLPDGDEYSVRMYGIDAPEQKQPGGREAHDYLRRVLRSQREWRLYVVNVDQYRRPVGVIYPEGSTVHGSANHQMIRSGFAYWYREYGGHELRFGEMERLAREEGVGVWSDPSAVRPWDYRRTQREERRHRPAPTRPTGPSPVEELITGVLKLLFEVVKVFAKAALASGSPRRRRRRRRRW